MDNRLVSNPDSNLRTPFIIEGILLIILGIIGISLPVLFTFATEIFIGSLLITLGVIQLFRSFSTYNESGFFVSLLGSIVAIAIGLLLLFYPLKGVLSLTIILIAYFVVQAVAKWIFASQIKGKQGAGWIFFSGLLSLILAGILFSGWPGTALWGIGLLVGIDLLFAGFSLLTVGWQIPKKA